MLQLGLMVTSQDAQRIGLVDDLAEEGGALSEHRCVVLTALQRSCRRRLRLLAST